MFPSYPGETFAYMWKNHGTSSGKIVAFSHCRFRNPTHVNTILISSKKHGIHQGICANFAIINNLLNPMEIIGFLVEITIFP
jgi:hypothetical protein